jgi:putative flippase GtrA
MISVSEIRQLLPRALKFGVTGITSTAIYVALSYTMINVLAFKIIVSSTLAFAAASVFSYLVNTFWSFSGQPGLNNLLKFIAVTAIGSVISSSILKYAILAGFGYRAGIIMILLIVPLVTFIAHHAWTYRRPVQAAPAD